MKLLITGGAGFIGANFIHYLFSTHSDYEIVNLDLLTYAGNVSNVSAFSHDARYSFIQGDICDEETVKKAMHGCDAVVHFAAETHVDRSIDDPFVFTKTNVMGTHVLLEEARKQQIRFHHISTDEVYGMVELDSEEQFDEQTPFNPRSPYSASKAASDGLVKSYFTTYDLPITITQCCNNYGPYQHPEKLLPLFITNLMQDKKVPVYGKGINVRDWLHVQDHCRAIDLVLHHGRLGETYCVGADAERNNLEMTHALLKIFHKGEEMIEFVKDRPGHDLRYSINSSKIRKELGWRPIYTLEQGLEELVSWYKSNESWWRPLKQNV